MQNPLEMHVSSWKESSMSYMTERKGEHSWIIIMKWCRPSICNQAFIFQSRTTDENIHSYHFGAHHAIIVHDKLSMIFWHDKWELCHVEWEKWYHCKDTWGAESHGYIRHFKIHYSRHLILSNCVPTSNTWHFFYSLFLTGQCILNSQAKMIE